MERLGDTHNFGKFVVRCGTWIKKPRTIYWEWLFLSESSPLRKFVDSNFEISPFYWYPDLNFQLESHSVFNLSGKVEEFRQVDPKSLDSNELSRALGACLANSIFWGMTDLHVDNVAVGIDPKATKPIVFPLDIETVFFNVSRLTESYFLKGIKNNNRVTGIQKLMDCDLNPLTVCEVFRDSILQYNSYSDDLGKLLEGLNLGNYPIRIIVKNTQTYYRYLTNKNEPGTDFFKEELIQLKRGDIPYFFTYLFSNKLLFIDESGVKSVNYKQSQLVLGKENHNFDRRSLYRKVDNLQIRTGVLQILRNLDTGGDYILESKTFRAKLEGKEILVIDDFHGKYRCSRLNQN